MTSMDPGDQFPVPELNRHDILRPFMFSPGTPREVWDDRSDYYDARDTYMGVNPEMVAMCALIADEMLLLEAGDAEVFTDEFELPESVSPYVGAGGIMVLNPDLGIRLVLDHQVKVSSDYGYFVHPVDSVRYEMPTGRSDGQPGRGDYSNFYILGLISRTDPRDKDEFDPPFALAISDDCRRARIVRRVSDETLAQRREADAVVRMGSQARADGEELLWKLHQEAAAEVRGRMRDSRLSHIADLTLTAMLGRDEVMALTATDEEMYMLGLDDTGGDELMISTSVDRIPLERLLAAQALLASPEAYE